MTDKKIIIEKDIYTLTKADLVEQLISKTQECERSRKRISDLEERIINHSNEIEEYCSRLADKNKECEELKERLERIEEDLKYQCVDCMNIKSDRYRKALEEIEEVADDYNRVGKTSQYYRDGFEQILDTINKAKGEGNE